MPRAPNSPVADNSKEPRESRPAAPATAKQAGAKRKRAPSGDAKSERAKGETPKRARKAGGGAKGAAGRGGRTGDRRSATGGRRRSDEKPGRDGAPGRARSQARASSGRGGRRGAQKRSGAKASTPKSGSQKGRAQKGNSQKKGPPVGAVAGGRPMRAAGSRRPSRGPLDPARLFLQRLVALMPDAVVTLMADGSIGQWSTGAARLTGRRRRDVQRRGFASVFRAPEVLEGLIDDLEDRGRVTDLEVSLHGREGADVPVRIHATRLRDLGPVRSGARQTEGERYLLILHDLTEVQRIRTRLIETEKLSAMAKIAGSVAHEFRNPLNSLFLTTDLLEDELEGNEDIQTAIAPTLAAIREEIERLNQIISHYLSLSKIASSAPQVMDLGEVVTEFAGVWAERAEQRGLRLRTKVDDGEHHISADPDQVRRILVNLVENAFDALDEESESRTRAGTVTLFVRGMRRSAKLTVKDNGPGIPEDMRERVLEPFVTSKSGGSGLGLYLVRETVLAAEGSMTLTSSDGRGTSVSVRWPLAAVTEEPASS